MSEANALQQAAKTRLRHRLFRLDGKLVYLLQGDREAVEVDERLWTSLKGEYDAEIELASKRLKRAFLLTIPAIIASLVIITNVPVLDAAGKWMDRHPPLGAILVFVVVAWLPLLALYLHASATQRAQEQVEARLTHLPRFAAPVERPKLHQNLQILVIMLAGPALLVHLVGTIFPDLFRNTPLSGTRLGWFDLAAALAVIAWFATRPDRNDR